MHFLCVVGGYTKIRAYYHVVHAALQKQNNDKMFGLSIFSSSLDRQWNKCDEFKNFLLMYTYEESNKGKQLDDLLCCVQLFTALPPTKTLLSAKLRSKYKL
jgi:hypothetical protein